jgi:hypothetical protein
VGTSFCARRRADETESLGLKLNVDKIEMYDRDLQEVHEGWSCALFLSGDSSLLEASDVILAE